MDNKRILHGTLYADGSLEVESNDRQLKITLSRAKLFHEGERREMFRATYYVKDGFEWERTIESANYENADEFLQAISKASDFSEAVRDIQQQKDDLRLAGSRNV